MPEPSKKTLEHDAQTRQKARSLFWQGWRVSAIAKELGVPRTTVHTWKESDGWQIATPLERVENTLDARLNLLINKDHKSNSDYKELEALTRNWERVSRIRKYEHSGREADLNPNIERRNDAPRKPKKGRNYLTDDQIAALERAFLESLYGYQLTWFECQERTRMIIKSRQIGATWYFAREALIDALKTGRNQIFISASKAQALVFREYIVQFVLDITGVQLSGETIILANGATLRFVGTNSRTAQSYNGNLYIDEFFWINKFADLKLVADGMSSHKHWRLTYFSTPSAKSHEAYVYWTGEAVNRNRADDDKLVIDLNDELLKAGVLGGDLVWRHKVTIYDAEAGGCDLFDIERLKIENSPDAFANKYECQFIDDALSAFSFTQLKRCMVDVDVAWDDFRRYTPRPYGDKPVWVGHDAGLTGDGSALVVVAPPDTPGGKFRLLEVQKFKGANYEPQAKALEQITKKYNVAYMGIDVTGGYGSSVHELVKKFYPRVKALNYNLEFKIRLVLKAQSIIGKRRFQFDVSETELVRAFLSIRKTLTKSQKAITFETGRNSQSGHGEIAWASMNTFIYEPLDEAVVGSKRSRMKVY